MTTWQTFLARTRLISEICATQAQLSPATTFMYAKLPATDFIGSEENSPPYLVGFLSPSSGSHPLTFPLPRMKLSICTAFFLFLLGLSSAEAQLTIKVTAIPANTPPGSSIYIAGTFNNWDPADATKILTPLGGGQFSIVLYPPNGTVKFKFTRGGWATVEGNANGSQQADHVTIYNGQAKTVQLPVLTWEDLSGSTTGSTAAPNVQVLSTDFYMPQLNRNRRIWLYLPPDYQSSTKKYPVLYMQDAQNLFDASTSFSGEWEVDETLNQLHAQGDYGCIVVGIDNGGTHRFDEYSPWVNSQYGGGEGDEYLEFMVNTLKPYIDANYRTLPGRNTTGIMGSSLGGLISMYSFSERQDVFSKAGIFSPAFWFAGNSPASHVATHPKQGEARVYFLAGDQEPAYVTQDMQAVSNAMTTAGFSASEKRFLTPSDGTHSEWFWAREFPAAYQWMFADAVTATGEPSSDSDLQIFPNPAGSSVRIGGLQASQKASVQIVGNDGKVWRDTTVVGNAPIWTGDLPVGFYVVRVKKTGGRWQSAKMVRE